MNTSKAVAFSYYYSFVRYFGGWYYGARFLKAV